MSDERRAQGALEAAVLSALWAHPDGLTPAQVSDEVDGDLAYTTVMTICTRLWKKGLVDRTRSGRAFVYRPLVTEDELAAQRLRDVLDPVEDRTAVLARFVKALPKRDADALRRLLDDR
jgi:predicted transcriptional regulator